MCVCVCVCVCERACVRVSERERVSVCVCERVSECVRACTWILGKVESIVGSNSCSIRVTSSR